MAGTTLHDWSMTDEELLAAIVAAGSQGRYAAEMRCARSTLQHQLDKRGILDECRERVLAARSAAAPGGVDADVEATVRNGNDEAMFYGLTREDLADADALMRRRGFDPAEWHVTNASITEWGRDPETGAPYQRLKVTLKRRVRIFDLLPANPDVPRIEVVPARKAPDDPTTWVLMSDQHIPYHDKRLHACALAFLRDVQPDRGLLGGDTLDLSHPSRHRRNPKFSALPQEGVDVGYGVLREIREASLSTLWEKILGNHDVRIRNFLLESSAPELATLRPANRGDEHPEDLTPAMAISRLLHLPELGIRCVEPEGEYGDEMATICRHLGLIHGVDTGRTAGDTELQRYGHSLAIAHTHRKATTWQTSWDWDGPSTRMAMQIGCMCEIKDGLGYTRRPNWQQGFGFATTWPDGRFNLEHVTYVSTSEGGHLFWRDQRWDSPS